MGRPGPDRDMTIFLWAVAITLSLVIAVGVQLGQQ
jgi:hypothetical protein